MLDENDNQTESTPDTESDTKKAEPTSPDAAVSAADEAASRTDDSATTQDSGSDDESDSPPVVVQSTRRRAAARPAGPPAALSTNIFSVPGGDDRPPIKPAKRNRPASKRTSDSGATKQPFEPASVEPDAPETQSTTDAETAGFPSEVEKPVEEKQPEVPAAPVGAAGGLMFQAPPKELAPAKQPQPVEPVEDESDADVSDDDDESGSTPKRRRRSRGGRRRRRNENENESTDDASTDSATEADGESAPDSDDVSDSSTKDAESDSDDADSDSNGSSRRRRRRARAGQESESAPDDPENTVVKVREGRTSDNEITAVTGSTRLEAKKQRRREGREAGRRRAPIISEAEFLARRESVNREMVVREQPDYTEIAVLEDDLLVEHYVARESQVSIIGNVYLGKVQNVLPSMEAAFIDIGAGRNAVLYAGEVDWTNVKTAGKQRKIEDALTPGQAVLVQVTKDPIGQKGARLTSQVSVPGRFLVYVPGGGTSGISRKLPDSERNRLKGLLKEVLPEEAGVIVRTAAEGATEEQLTRDITALTARWQDIEQKVTAGKAPELLYAEPDLTIKVIRDMFNEDFASLTVQGPNAWDMVSGYISHVAPDLADRLNEWRPEDGKDVFAARRIDEQIRKALERKVHLPSGGSLVIDRTEAMTVVDVNTGRFTGSGGNLEETVTKNNLEAAEEMVRQLRLRDIGGIIVIDFIDMVLESNRDLVLRRLVECLGRDRTRHQVAEVTSLGLVQMTRKRIGTGLLESFSHECDHCNGRGVVIDDEPIEPKRDEPRRGRRGGRSNNKQRSGNDNAKNDNAKSDSSKSDSAQGSDGANGDSNDGSSQTSQASDSKNDADSAHSAEQSADTTNQQPSSGNSGRPSRKNRQQNQRSNQKKAAELASNDAVSNDVTPDAADSAEVNPDEAPTPEVTAETSSPVELVLNTDDSTEPKPELTASEAASEAAPAESSQPAVDQAAPSVEPAGPKIVRTQRTRKRASRPAAPPSESPAITTEESVEQTVSVTVAEPIEPVLPFDEPVGEGPIHTDSDGQDAPVLTDEGSST